MGASRRWKEPTYIEKRWGEFHRSREGGTRPVPRREDNSRDAPKGEHQSNGQVEEAGRTIRDHARVLKIHIQSKIGRELDVDEPIMPWLLRWAAMSISRFQKGADGKTPYERQRGRKCDIPVVPFGETVRYRKPEVARDSHQALEERWGKGI